jgi:hypothetical protein
MHSILSEESKFKRMTREQDKTRAIEKAVCKLLSRLKQEGVIDQATLEQIRPTGTVIPRMYGLPKVHKPGVPLRPILDMHNSPYHQLAKWLVSLLEPLRKEISTHSVKDSFDFVNHIERVHPVNQQMFSLDVSSLFTNVPLVETINYICEQIELRGMRIGIPVPDLKKLLLLCTHNVQFSFDNQIYRQIDGVAMGSPLGPLLADIFMSKLENGPLNNLIGEFKLYLRYMDDIFVLAAKEVEVSGVLEWFNSAHPNLQFTVELESNNQLNFLDVSVIRTGDGSFRRRVYRKPTWTGQYTHFLSFVPLKQKRNLIRCLTQRAIRICSGEYLKDELKKKYRTDIPTKWIPVEIRAENNRINETTS